MRKNRNQIDHAFGGGLRVLGSGWRRCPIDPRCRQMPVNPVKELVLSASRPAELFDGEVNVEFDCIRGDRLHSDRWGGRRQNRLSIQDSLTENFGTGRWECFGVELDRYGDAMDAGGGAGVDDLG